MKRAILCIIEKGEYCMNCVSCKKGICIMVTPPGKRTEQDNRQLHMTSVRARNSYNSHPILAGLSLLSMGFQFVTGFMKERAEWKCLHCGHKFMKRE